MISCKDCATLNSLDSAFCKKCGKPLAKEEAIDARETLDKQLDHAFELFHHGRTDEAWLNLETCLISDPENLRAISLKGMILERRHLIHEAIACYETIVEKDPNAALERMKLQTLRGQLDTEKYRSQPMDRRTALMIAVCAGLLVFSIVAAIAYGSSRRETAVAQNDGVKPSYTIDSFTSQDREQAAKQAAQQQSQTSGQDDSSNANATDQSDPSQQVDTSHKVSAAPTGSALPDPTKTDAASDAKPVNPFANASIKPIDTQTDQTQNATNNANIGAPTNTTPNTDPDPSTVTPADTKPADPPPVVDIKLSNDPGLSEADMAIDKNGIEALVRTARGQYQVGNYQAAAATYEKALSAGADPAMTNQRLAQCYERLGQTSEAKDAYGRAINAIQNQINGGKGNKDRLLAELNSSQQALKNLQGG